VSVARHQAAITSPALSRGAGFGRAAAPVRHVHLGLGGFFRAHQAWYTDRSPDAAEWGIAGFAGRSAGLATRLTAQDGLYTVVSRGADRDNYAVVSSLSRAHAADDAQAWQAYLASPDVCVLSLTVTEAAYLRGAAGGLDVARSDVQADIAQLRNDVRGLPVTVPGRIVAGLAARRLADAGPLTLLSCDNLPDNGAVLARVVSDLAAAVDPALAAWIDGSVSSVSTMVDRITPATTAADIETVRRDTGRLDTCPVVTEPYSEWVLCGTFAAGRPAWDHAGAIVTTDLMPYEHRKLWLLNGAHSLLAYAGAARGHRTVSDALADDVVHRWVEAWWEEASRHLPFAPEELVHYRDALLARFANPRIEHRLSQIAADGSQKIPARVLPVLRRERSSGSIPTGAVRALAGWVAHLRGYGVPVADAAATTLAEELSGVALRDAVPRALATLEPGLADDRDLLDAVVTAAGELERDSPKA
jgi:fructuronate reductase